MPLGDAARSFFWSPLGLVLWGAAVIALSGFLGLAIHWSARLADRLAAWAHLAGAAVAAGGLWLAMNSPEDLAAVVAWGLPWGSGRLELDGISLAFLVPMLLVPAMGSWFGLRYWSSEERPESARLLRVWYGLLSASLILVLLARDGVLFLLAWEGMALSAFFLVGTEHEFRAVRVGAWIYFIATRVGTLALLTMFALLCASTGSFAIAPIGPGIGQGMKLVLFLLAVIGFGSKAGLMPFHVWLPPAHACAPSHVSAVLSGVVIKVGIYGLVRVTAILPDPPIIAGGMLLGLGVASGILGVLYAIGQHDLKRLLAYHSIENIGIIAIGLGLALLGRSLGRPEWVALGLAGAILHVWNHAFFKSLLFLSAGSVIHATGIREVDRLGGLARRMPWTSAFFLVGSVAICGLPPLNGFVSEFFVYLGLLRTVQAGELASVIGGIGAPALAMVGALAVACFVKVYGAVFLGHGRSELGEVHEAPAAMVAPMALLAAACLLIGLAPGTILSVLDRANASWLGPSGLHAPKLDDLAPVGAISLAALVILSLCAALFFLLRRRLGGGPHVVTWDCGYAAPSPRMQYTASSIAQELVRLSAWVLRPREKLRHSSSAFPVGWRYASRVSDVVLDAWILPAWRRLERWMLWCRVLQQGRIQMYLFYVLLALAAAILSAAPLQEFLEALMTT